MPLLSRSPPRWPITIRTKHQPRPLPPPAPRRAGLGCAATHSGTWHGAETSMLPREVGATGIAWPQLDQPRPAGRLHPASLGPCSAVRRHHRLKPICRQPLGRCAHIRLRQPAPRGNLADRRGVARPGDGLLTTAARSSWSGAPGASRPAPGVWLGYSSHSLAGEAWKYGERAFRYCQLTRPCARSPRLAPPPCRLATAPAGAGAGRPGPERLGVDRAAEFAGRRRPSEAKSSSPWSRAAAALLDHPAISRTSWLGSSRLAWPRGRTRSAAGVAQGDDASASSASTPAIQRRDPRPGVPPGLRLQRQAARLPAVQGGGVGEGCSTWPWSSWQSSGTRVPRISRLRARESSCSRARLRGGSARPRRAAPAVIERW